MSQRLDTTSAVIAEHLAQAGVTSVFGYPGSSNIEFMEGARQRGVEVVLARREASAAFMAEGYGMLTGTPGVCISTLGPGSTALLNGVAAATLDRVPMIAISGQIASDKEPYFTHQVVDHNRLYAPVTKWAGRVEPKSVDVVMRKALRTAVAERPGAVHLTHHADVATDAPGSQSVVLPPSRPMAHAAQVFTDGDDPWDVLREAKRPVMLAGIAAMRAEATAELVAFAETTGTPTVVSPMAKGVFPEDHPYFAGVLDMACNEVVWGLLDEADLVLAVGFDAVELIKPWNVTARVMHVDTLPNTDQVYAADIELVGHIPHLLSWLRDGSSGAPRWDEAELDAYRGRLTDAYYAGRVSGRMNPTDVVDVLRGTLPRDTVLTTDVGSHKLLVGQGWTTYEPRTMLMTNGLSSMGFSLPAAIAAKLVYRDRPVVCTVGDGGFAMVQGELRLASALGLGIVIVVFCDNSLNRIELKQLKLGYPSTATRIESTDLVALAGSMECDGVRVDDQAALEKTLQGSGTLDRPLVIEAHIDPSQYESQF